MKTYGIATGDKVEKFHVALLFNKGSHASPDWIQLCKATENTINANAETEDLDFIVDKNPTTIIKRYKPTLSNPLTMYKGDEDYEYFFPKFYDLPTGADANGEMLVVFMNEATETGSGESKTVTYKAWLCDTTFVFDSLDPANSQLTFTTNVNGTIAKGEVSVSSLGVPTFTPEA